MVRQKLVTMSFISFHPNTKGDHDWDYDCDPNVLINIIDKKNYESKCYSDRLIESNQL